MRPLDLRLVQSLLRELFFLLQDHHGLLHLSEALVGALVTDRAACGTHVASLLTTVLLDKHVVDSGLIVSQMRHAELHGPLVNKTLEFLFQLIDPVHRVQRLERRMLHRVRYVRQSVECQELRCL
jgi:hypothetical protein